MELENGWHEARYDKGREEKKKEGNMEERLSATGQERCI